MEVSSTLLEAKHLLLRKYADAENVRKTRLANLQRDEEASISRFACDLAVIADRVTLLAGISHAVSVDLHSVLGGLQLTFGAMKHSLEKHGLEHVTAIKDSSEEDRKSYTQSSGWKYKGKEVFIPCAK